MPPQLKGAMHRNQARRLPKETNADDRINFLLSCAGGENIMCAMCGEQHHRWKGNDAGVTSIHIWVRKQLLKTLPLQCTECGSTEYIEVANINNHIYTRDVNDYTFLCRACHKKKDGSPQSRRLIRIARNAPPRTDGCKTYAISDASVAIALKYGKNVSQGILELDRLIRERQHQIQMEFENRLISKYGRVK